MRRCHDARPRDRHQVEVGAAYVHQDDIIRAQSDLASATIVAIAKELKTEHLTVAYMPTPRHVLCPTWLHERVHQALKERSEKDVYVCNTFGRAATNPLIEMKMQLRRIFRPWWCELTLVV